MQIFSEKGYVDLVLSKVIFLTQYFSKFFIVQIIYPGIIQNSIPVDITIDDGEVELKLKAIKHKKCKFFF